MNEKPEKMGPEEYSPSEWDDNEKERVINKLHSKIGRILNPQTEDSKPVLVTLPDKWQDVFQKMFQCFEKHRKITWTLHLVEANPPNVPIDQKLEMKTESGSISVLYQSEGSTSRVLLQFPENEKFPENWTTADIEIVLFAIYLLIRHHLKYGEYDVEDDLILIDMVMVHAETLPHIPQLCQACRLRRCPYLFKSRANQIYRIFRRRSP